MQHPIYAKPTSRMESPQPEWRVFMKALWLRPRPSATGPFSEAILVTKINNVCPFIFLVNNIDYVLYTAVFKRHNSPKVHVSSVVIRWYFRFLVSYRLLCCVFSFVSYLQLAHSAAWIVRQYVYEQDKKPPTVICSWLQVNDRTFRFHLVSWLYQLCVV